MDIPKGHWPIISYFDCIYPFYNNSNNSFHDFAHSTDVQTQAKSTVRYSMRKVNLAYLYGTIS